MPDTQSNKPPVPTMTTASLIPAMPPPRNPYAAPEEFAEDIIAMPLGALDFANDVKPFLTNKNLHPRWIFTDRRRYTQALAQGWRNAKQTDFVSGYTKLSPFTIEGGTKYINGDLILMLIDRKIYLGALRYKHQVAASLADAASLKAISAGKAVNELGSTVAAANQKRAASGDDPVMTVFTPGQADISHTVLGQAGNAAKELGRLGNDGSRDTGSLQDLADKSDQK
jgi:hypothetical protein